MPGGATSSSQEGALKQGYIRLLPYMLRFLAGTRKIIRYHDVTPGSQITWNTAFLAVTGAYKRGGEHHVRHLLDILETVASTPEKQLSPDARADRLKLYQDSNDAFRDLLLGKYGRLPLGFPPDWVYQSAFGADYQKALGARTEASPLDLIEDVDIDRERESLVKLIKRHPTEEELIMYLNHPGDAVKTIEFQKQYGDPNQIPLDVWFEGLERKKEIEFIDKKGKPHKMMILDITEPRKSGLSTVRYLLDSEMINFQVKVREPETMESGSIEMADPKNKFHVGSPSNGDLWVMYVAAGDYVRQGEELFNVSIMKQEKAVVSPMDGVVRRVLKSADYKQNRKMVAVQEGELLVELGPAPSLCGKCSKPLPMENILFCPYCGKKVSAAS
jgi:pyruvate carboxylase